MAQTTRDNHFVPQWYLKSWANERGLVCTYRLLVSHSKVPVWDEKSPRGVGFHRDLYTTVDEHRESDEFERWLAQEFEIPAQRALTRVLNDLSLQPHHWQHLARYAMCQQIRTPQYYLESMVRWEKTFPTLIQDTLERAVKLAEDLHDKGESLPRPARRPENAKHLDGAFKITIDPNAHPSDNAGEIGVSMVLGRDLWIRAQRHLLEGVGWVSALHSWSIAEPADGYVWCTSDQPVARVNWDDDGFNLGAGWGSRGATILMPLSPKHLLVTQVGEQLPDRLKFSQVQTERVVQVLAHRAHRLIFADRQLRSIEVLRPRHVDVVAFQSEFEQWRQWHAQQSSAQLGSDS